MKLYTGRAAWVIEKSKDFTILNLLVILIVNILSVCVVAVLLFKLGYNETAFLKAQEITEGIITNGFVTNVFKGVMCGILIYSAVTVNENIVTMVCVTVFIMCGFRHSIADMFYYIYAGIAFKDFIIPELAVIIGNFIGCITIPVLKRL